MANKNIQKEQRKDKGGRPTKYTPEFGEKLASLLSCMTLEKACKTVGIDETTYYEWHYKYDEFSQLSTKARKTKAVHHFTECQKVLDECREARKTGDTAFRSDLARLEADFHLRLAGKANQGLFGDSATLRGDPEAPLNPVVRVILNKTAEVT